MGSQLSQIFPRTPPALTEANMLSQHGRIFLVTGGYGGIGYHISRILYRAGGRVYVAGRDEKKAQVAIEKIKGEASSRRESPGPGESGGHADGEPGQLEFLYMDLSDLSTIEAAGQEFLSKEKKLDVLFHNAGVSLPPAGSVSVQGHELTVATNCLGPWLLNHFLTPALIAAAKDDSAKTSDSTSKEWTGKTRVIFTASQVVDLSAPKGGINLSDLDNPSNSQDRNYTTSKTGNFFLSSEFHRRTARENGILSITVNPGGLKTDILRHTSWLFRFCVRPLLHDAVYGAYTVLWAALSADLTIEEDGGKGWIVPWGRRHPSLRADLLESLKDEEEGGSGKTKRFWEWCEGRCKDFM